MKRRCRSSPPARPMSSNAMNDVSASNDKPRNVTTGAPASSLSMDTPTLTTVAGQHRSEMSASTVSPSAPPHVSSMSNVSSSVC